MNNKTKIGLGILALVIAFGIGRFSKPAKVETKEVVKTVVQKEEAKVKIVYKEKVTSPDGTTTEKEVSREDTNSTENSSTSKVSESSVKNDAGLTIQALAIANISDITGKQEYGLSVKKRVIGNLGFGILATTDKKIGVGISVDF